MVQTPANPGGLPKKVFDGFQAQVAANRAQFYLDLPTGPFYGFNRPGAKPSEGIIRNWWRQGMMGEIKAHYDGIVAFSQTDFTEDLKAIDVASLVMPRRGRPDRAVRRFRPPFGKVAEKQQDEILSGISARHARDECRHDQCRSAGIHSRIVSCFTCNKSAALSFAAANQLQAARLKNRGARAAALRGCAPAATSPRP